jgi:acetyl-CoA C-acetyltransferase
VQKYKLTREAQDAFAAQSQQRFAAAQAAGWFDAEIEPVALKAKKGPTTFAADEANRPEMMIESLAKLRPVFRPDGTITAGGAVLITKAAHALKRTGGSKAVVSLCIGGGQGIALCLERV